LIKPAVSRELLDRFANLELSSYQEVFARYQEISERIEKLNLQLQTQDREIELLKEFANEFAKVSPKSGELVQVENEIAKLGSVEQLNQSVTNALNLLDSEDLSALNILQQVRKSLDSMAGKDNELDRINERFTENLLNFSDIQSDLNSYLLSLEADPTRFAYLQDRKSVLTSLLKRYGKGSDKQQAFEEFIIEGLGVKQKLSDLSGGSDRVVELEKEKAQIFNELKELGAELSSKRKLAGTKLSELVTLEIRNLSMPNAQFIIDQKTLSDSNPDNFSYYGLG